MKIQPVRLFGCGVSQLILGITACGLPICNPVSAAVPNADITLQPVVSSNIPTTVVITAVGKQESEAALPGYDTPMYYPYDGVYPAWQDNLVQEQLQARIPVVMLLTTGTKSTNPVDWMGGNNPFQLKRYIDAFSRAGAYNTTKLAFFYAGGAYDIYANYYGTTNQLDFANTDCWDQIWWQRVVKPWFDTVPSSYWYKYQGDKVVLQFWGLNIAKQYRNQEGNVSQLFDYLSAKIQATYGVKSCFMMGGTYCDTTLASCSVFVGDNAWFTPPSIPYTMTSYKGKVWGCAVAGYDVHNGNPSSIIPRNGISGTGANGDTLKAGLEATMTSNAALNVIEGYTDLGESCGLYRSAVSPKWDYPNQYINMMRAYSDLRTVTLKLEAEGCDEYSDTTTGNSGGSFLRAPENLDVRSFAGEPVATASSTFSTGYASNAFDRNLDNKWITVTAPPGWIQWDNGTGYKDVVTGYSLTSANNNVPADPASWQLLASNNGTTWVTLDSRSGQTFAARRQTNTYSFTNSTPYQYYRLNVTATAGTGGGIQVADLFLKTSNPTGGGWAVTNTAAGEWIQFKGVTFSEGNYKFPIRYSSSADRTVRLLIDGVALPNVVLPATGGMNVFDTAYLGSKSVAHGSHTLRLEFIDGGIDVDWVFVKKYDPLMTFYSAVTESYVTAELGGNSSLVSNRKSVGSWEKFSVNDVLGSGAVGSGRSVSIQASNGLYLCALNAGGSSVVVNRRGPSIWEHFKIMKTSGTGNIGTGDTVAFQCHDGVHYLTVNANGTMDTNGTSIGAEQTFTVGLYTQ